MGALREWLSNFVNKIKSIFGRKKVVQEKSDDLFGALTASPEAWSNAVSFAPQYPATEMEVVHNEAYPTQNTPEQQNKDIWSDPEPTAMAA